MSAKTIFVEPSDVWLFRDGRPFAPNERGRAVSLFPPTPQTTQGIIRSLRLARSGESFEYTRWSPELRAEIGEPPENGKPENFGALRLRGPLLAEWNGEKQVKKFFPLPPDVIKLKNKGWHVLAPDSEAAVQTNWISGLQMLLPPDDSEPEKFDAGWLNENGLRAYLRGVCGLSADHMIKTNALYQHEARFGVQIDSQPKRPAEGMLYQVEFIRVRAGMGLLLEVEGVELPEAGLLQAGGEARAGRFQTVETSVALPRAGREPRRVNDRRRFKLYFATPAMFANGWLPGWLDVQTLRGQWDTVKVQLIAAAVGKPQAIGGRDLARNSHRYMRRAVPAGSVYYFETEASADEVLAAFDGQCVSDLETDARIGFGLGYVGGW